MHQRVATEPAKIVRMYQRGVLTCVAAANDLVEVTNSPPPPELVAAVPTELLARLRELAALEVAPRRFAAGGYCRPAAAGPGHDGVGRDELVNWLIGQSFWRTYFDANPDPTT